MPEKLRVPHSPLAEGVIVLDDAASRYVTRVHRLAPGDAIVLFDPDAGVEADARIDDAGARVRCHVGAVRPGACIPSVPLTLVQGLGKGDKAEQVIRDATALSVTRVVLAQTLRSVARISDRDDSKRARLRSVAIEAARQSGRGDVPEIRGPVPLSEALALVPPGAVRLCLSPGAPESLGSALAGLPAGAAVVLFVGPEGGFDEGELRTLVGEGATRVSLGELVLRTELAAAAALGAVLAARRRRS